MRAHTPRGRTPSEDSAGPQETSIARRTVTVAPAGSLPCDDAFSGALVIVASGRVALRTRSGLALWFDTGDTLVVPDASLSLDNDQQTPAVLTLITRRQRPPRSPHRNRPGQSEHA